MTKKETQAFKTALEEITNLKNQEAAYKIKLEASDNLVKELRRDAADRFVRLERVWKKLMSLGRMM